MPPLGAPTREALRAKWAELVRQARQIRADWEARRIDDSSFYSVMQEINRQFELLRTQLAAIPDAEGDEEAERLDAGSAGETGGKGSAGKRKEEPAKWANDCCAFHRTGAGAEPLLEAPRKRFRVALSFPGEYREFLREVAERLAQNLGKERVFYDKYYEAELARPDLDTYLQAIYHDHSDLTAVFLCAEYERKDWCGLEWRAIRDLIKQRQASDIMPFRFDDTQIPGLFSIDGYVSAKDRPPCEIAALILERLDVNDRR